MEKIRLMQLCCVMCVMFVSFPVLAAPPPATHGKAPVPTKVETATQPTKPDVKAAPTPESKKPRPQVSSGGGKTPTSVPTAEAVTQEQLAAAVAQATSQLNERNQVSQRIFLLSQRMKGVKDSPHFPLFSKEEAAALDPVSAEIEKVNGDFLMSTGPVPEGVKAAMTELQGKVNTIENTLAEKAKAGKVPITNSDFSLGMYDLLWVIILLLSSFNVWLMIDRFTIKRQLDGLLVRADSHDETFRKNGLTSAP